MNKNKIISTFILVILIFLAYSFQIDQKISSSQYSIYEQWKQFQQEIISQKFNIQSKTKLEEEQQLLQQEKSQQFQSNLLIPTSLQSQISYLYKSLQTQHYWSHTQPFKLWRTWQHVNGIYQSRIHFNILDKRNSFLIDQFRDNVFKIDDVNMFVSSFVLYGLQEAANLGTIKLDTHKFSQTLQAITQFRDKNTEKGLPQYIFWPQTLINGTWTAGSVNLIGIVNSLPTLPKPIRKWMNNHGLDFISFIKSISKAFSIPADNDDSGVNLALLGLLKQSNSSHFSFFNSFNFNKLGFYQRVLKYSYRPFDNNFTIINQSQKIKRNNQIDPRTYYVLHPFLTKVKQQAQSQNKTPSLILPTTWLINSDQQIPDHIIMPFESNNVDATVSANFLFGLIYQLMTDQISIYSLSQQLIKMSYDTVKLIQYVIKQVSHDRLDLILVYYPSKYDFFWFVSRIVNLLKRYQEKLQQEQFKDFKNIYQQLQKLMKNQGTKLILESKKTFISKNKKVNAEYWAQFLGNYAKKERNHDSLFSTALALNALLDTWTYKKNGKITYDKDITQAIKQTIKNGITYISYFVNKQMTSTYGYQMTLVNAFFSGSMKIFKTSFPYFYPANVHYDKNGKQFDPNTMQMKDIQFGSKYYMKGYIEKDVYNQMLKKKWFGSQVPTKFSGYNDGKGLTFPYWSSQAITEVMMINSISKYIKVNE